MARSFNRKNLAAFIQRRRINALGLTVITAASAVITLLCALNSFKHTDILVLVTIALVALCFLQYFRSRRGFKTMRAFKGSLKKKNSNE